MAVRDRQQPVEYVERWPPSQEGKNRVIDGLNRGKQHLSAGLSGLHFGHEPRQYCAGSACYSNPSLDIESLEQRR